MDTHSAELKVTSPAFDNEGQIPSKYTCDGEGINPPLEITNIPEDAKTLALIVEDPDAPKGVFDHWIVWNIDPVTTIDENSNPGTSGDNSAGKSGFHPPCPPSGSHRYYFYIFALDVRLDLPAGSKKEALKTAMNEHILAQGSIMGTYQRKQKS